MVPDTGYFGLKGDAAIKARAGVEQQLNDLRAAGRQGLSPEAQLQYDATTRRLATGNGERIGQHFAQQEVVYQQGVHQGSADNSLNGISVNPLDGDSIAHHTRDLIDARVNAVRLAGGGPEQQTAAINDARRDAVRAQVEAVAAKDPQKALEILEAKKADAGAYYAPLQERLQGRAYAAQGNGIADAVFKGQPIPGQPGAAAAPAQSGAAPTAPNGLPQEGPMPPARGDGGPPTSPGAGTIAQPTYAQWRGTLSKSDRVEFDGMALAYGQKNKIGLPDAQAAIYQRFVDHANAHGDTLPGGAAPAAATSTQPAAPAQGQPSTATAAQQPLQDLPPALATPQGKDPRFVYLPQKDAADRIIASKTASAADKASARAVVDRWNHQDFAQPGLVTVAGQDAAAGRALGPVPAPDTSDHTSYPTLVVNPKTGRADTSGAPEIDRSHVAPAAAAPAAAPAAQPQPGQNRDVSPTPTVHPATQAIPYFAQNFENDRAHALPPAIAGAAALPYFNKAGAPYGISGNYLSRTWQIESNSGKNKGTSSAGALGDFQFIPSTWAKYGNGGDRNDFGASTMAAVRLAADNKAGLTHTLGRAPTDAELYLAHQQGLGGATKLLMNPGARAGDLVGDKAVSANGGDPNETAATFAGRWINKFNGVRGKDALPMFAAGFGAGQPYYGGAPGYGVMPPIMPDAMAPPAPAPAAPMPSLMQQAPAAPAMSQAPPPLQAEQPQFRDPKADAYARIEAMDVPQEVKQHAFQRLNQMYQEQQIAEEQDQRARKARSDQAYGGYTTRALNGEMGPGILQQIANDRSLLPETKWTLSNAIIAESKRQGDDREARNFGPGYARTLSAITADPGDPGRISDPVQVLHMVHDGSLTLAGADKLIGAMRLGTRSADDHAAEVARAGIIRLIHDRMSFESPEIHLRDRAGEAAFNGKFVPQYEAAFDRWVKAGKDPWEFLNDTKSAEALADRLRPRSQMEADRLAALNGDGTPGTGQTAPNPFGAGGEVQAPAEPPPQPNPRIPAPAGTNADGWSAVMTNLPPSAPGQRPFTADDWAAAVQRLAADPSPDTIARWNSSKLGRAGYDAAAVLHHVRPDVRVASPPAPAMTLDLGQMGP